MPFLDYDAEIRTVLCSTNAIESLSVTRTDPYLAFLGLNDNTTRRPWIAGGASLMTGQWCGYGVVISMTRSFWLLGCWMLTHARRLSVGSKYSPVNSEPGVPFEAHRPRPSPTSVRSPS